MATRHLSGQAPERCAARDELGHHEAHVLIFSLYISLIAAPPGYNPTTVGSSPLPADELSYSTIDLTKAIPAIEQVRSL